MNVFIYSSLICKSVIKKSSVKYFLIFESPFSSSVIFSSSFFRYLFSFQELSKLSKLIMQPDLNFITERPLFTIVFA